MLACTVQCDNCRCMSLYTNGLARKKNLNDKQGAILFLNTNVCGGLEGLSMWHEEEQQQQQNSTRFSDSIFFFFFFIFIIYFDVLICVRQDNQHYLCAFMRWIILLGKSPWISIKMEKMIPCWLKVHRTDQIVSQLLKRPKENAVSVWELLFLSQRSIQCLLPSSSLCSPVQQKRTVGSARQGGSWKPRKWQLVWNPNPLLARCLRQEIVILYIFQLMH